jgi:hypothetical protein
MKRISTALLGVLLLSACAYQDQLTGLYTSPLPVKPLVSTEPEKYQTRCAKITLLPVKTRQLYDDHYGTMMTVDPSSLRGYRGSYRWGITNPGQGSMQYFGAYVKPNGKYGYFRTYLYIDSGIKDTMIFQVRNNDPRGEVLQQVSIDPGQTKVIDVQISGMKKIYIGSELKINHGNATRMIFGEPEFYNCAK